MNELNKCLKDGTRWDYTTRKGIPTQYYNFHNLKKFIRILEEESGLKQNIDFGFVYDNSRYSQKIHLVIADPTNPGTIKPFELGTSITKVFIDEWEKILTFLKGVV